MTQATEQSPEELFRDLSDRFIMLGLPFQEVLAAAKEQQDAGHEGISFVLDPDAEGAGAIVAVNREGVDFKVGGLGPYVLGLDTVMQIIEPPLPEQPPQA